MAVDANTLHLDAASVADAINEAVADGETAATTNDVRVVTGAGAFLPSDVGHTVLATGAASFTLTLPASMPKGKINVLNGSTGKVTVAATGPATVEGILLGLGLILDAKAAGSLSTSAANVWHLAGGAAS